ncbi:hypothetical protein ACN42_g11792 [Penicillium freii]|uniref:Uncharacterized protein n=1 Tax=Penicillium freii TaxID=48697 RepID=A0A124GPM9_PENFR|nr:hypothetical protein ACN42_g11792 [Penicillium freii]
MNLGTAVWPSGLRRLTRNQFRSRAHVRIMQPSLHIFFCMAKRICGFDQVIVPFPTHILCIGAPQSMMIPTG